MRLLLAAVLGLVGCAQGSPVKGRFVYRYPDGTTLPVDMSGTQFQVFVPDGSSFRVYPAEPVPGTAEGTFEIPDVPEGRYLLRRTFASEFGILTTLTEHDFVETWDELGRPDAAPATASTPIQIDATGLAAWQPGDQLYVGCFGNATEGSDPLLTPELTTNATEIHSAFDWAKQSSWALYNWPYLMDASAGDQLVITHARAQTSGDVQTLGLTQILTTAAPTQIDQQPSSVSGTFQNVGQTENITVTIPADQLAAEAEAGAKPSLGWNVVVGPYTAQQLFLGPELARATSTVATAPVTTSVTYGNPFDPSWKPFVGAWFEADRMMSGNPFTVPSIELSESRPLDGTTYTFEPLSPVGSVTINGQQLSGGPITIASDRAVRVELDEPTEASSGRLIVWRLDTFEQTAYVSFDRAPVDLPPNMFQSGARYALEIDVYSDDGNGRTRSSGTYTDSFQLIGR